MSARRDHAGATADRPFELRIVPRGRGEYAVAIDQPPTRARRNGGPARPVRLVTVWGTPLRAVADRLLEALKRNGYRPTDLAPDRRLPFRLDEETGVRLGLTLLAIKPLHRTSRIEAISAGVREMEAEEAYYWFSKCTARGRARRGQKAIRALLAED